MSDLIFIGYTNGHQIGYASEGGEGRFYSDTENECYIPLYMLKCHAHRIESTSDGEISFYKLNSELTTLRQQNAELVEALINQIDCPDAFYSAENKTVTQQSVELIQKIKGQK